MRASPYKRSRFARTPASISGDTVSPVRWRGLQCRPKVADFRDHNNLRFSNDSLSEGVGAGHLHSANCTATRKDLVVSEIEFNRAISDSAVSMSLRNRGRWYASTTGRLGPPISPLHVIRLVACESYRIVEPYLHI